MQISFALPLRPQEQRQCVAEVANVLLQFHRDHLDPTNPKQAAARAMTLYRVNGRTYSVSLTPQGNLTVEREP